MLENRTMAEILAAMKQTVGSALDLREGSFTDNVLRAAALEIANDYFDQNALVPIAFVDETSGVYIDRRAAEYGITRKTGAKATVTVTFAGKDGAVVPAGTAVVTLAGLRYTTDEACTITDGTATASATAEANGAVYNVDADTIVSLQSGGRVTVSSSTAASGGEDDESDAALLARLLAKWREPGTSGNANDYKKWALEVDGVGAAIIVPLWAGNGTVKVVLASTGMGTAPEELIAAVKSHIEELRPIGASVTVVSAEAKQINVSGKITVGKGTSVSGAAADFTAALGKYLESLAMEGTRTVSYNRIWYLLMSTYGVEDCTQLLVNGGTANIALASGEIAEMGTVTIDAAD